MNTQMNRSDQEIEELVEAQARGETVQNLPVEAITNSEAELDARVSKLAVQPSGFLVGESEAQPTGFPPLDGEAQPSGFGE